MPYIVSLATACAALGLLILGVRAVRRRSVRIVAARDIVDTVDGVPVTSVEYQVILAQMDPDDRQLVAAAYSGCTSAVDAIPAAIVFTLAVRAYREQ